MHHRAIPSYSVSIILILWFMGCASPSPTQPPASETSNPEATMVATPTNVIQMGIWDELLQAKPIPHEFPLPKPGRSALDGTYAKVDQSPPQFWTCYRCADYRPMGGIWRLQFKEGVMRIFYQITNWKSITSFTVEDNRLKIFNDPFCPQDVGEYEWAVDGGNLTLTAVKDGCAADLRKENLTKQTWNLCNPNGQQQEACREPLASPPTDQAFDLSLMVTVHSGDSHYFDKPPEVFAAANKDNVPSPQGIQIQADPESIPYGTHQVLWWKGDWIEASTELPFSSIGVQLWGSGYLGWARVLFDEHEVWRGPITSLGKKHAYYGGYIEIAGFEPGLHTIRVENLSFDYRAVKVAAFGFSNQPVEK